MKKIGDVELRLAKGPIPHYKELKELERSIVKVIIEEFGTEELIKRYSNPLWFDSLACLLGFEWNYSGMTTVTLKALKEISIEDNIPIIVLGGKGKDSKITEEIETKDIKDKLKDKIKDVSITSAKVDNYLIQDGYNLYFHFLISDEKSNMTIINQKMSIKEQKVRRFHWININYFDDSQIGFGSNTKTLNLSSKESEENRKTTVDLISMGVKKIKEDYKKLQFGPLDKWINRNYKIKASVYRMPWNINWEAINKLYEKEPRNYIEILETEGIGPSTIRALALISEIIYGSPASWRDPVKFTFAHGGKDGVPYPVNKKVYENSISILHDAVKRAEIKEEMKKLALERIENISEKMFRMIK